METSLVLSYVPETPFSFESCLPDPLEAQGPSAPEAEVLCILL